MRKLIFAFLICFITQQVCSQGNFYIYIQSEDNTPFYVRSGSKTFQSSGNGYLIIPNLLNDTYDLIIGFPETAGPEWKFTCSIAEKDLGFILKNNHSKGVELNGLKQEKGLTGAKIDNKPEKKGAAVKQPVGIISDDPFSSMLAEVVNDPTIKQQPIIILTARDSLNLAKAQKKDSVTTSLAVNNKLPEIKTVPAVDSAKAIVKTNTPVLPADKKITDDPAKDKKVDSTLVASAKAVDSAAGNKAVNAKDVAKNTAPGIITGKKAEEKSNKIDSVATTAVKLRDSTVADNKAVAVKDGTKTNVTVIPADKKTIDEKGKEKKIDSAAVAAVIKPAVTDKKVTDKATSAIDKKTDSAANKGVTALTNPTTADTKDVVKKDSSKNSKVLTDTKKKTDSTAVAAVIKPAVTDKKVTDKTTSVIDKKADSAANKTATTINNTTPADTKALAKNDVTKNNPVIIPDTKKKGDSIVAATTKPTTVAPAPEIKKTVVVSSTAIKKTLQRKSADGTELIYIDEMSDGTKETIRILIPAAQN